jgi:hypothetical protein
MSEHGPSRPHPEHTVLEIGDELGALVLYTDPDLVGTEPEISLTGHDDERQHKEVLERPVGGRSVYAATFDGLHEGTYTLWLHDEARTREVAIVGGRVSECDWRGSPSTRG